MSEIRALRDADLPAVEGLLDALLPGWGGDREFLAATILAHPWADPELTSLVTVDEHGEVFGFIGTQVRRLRFDDRELRGVCCSHLVVAPNRRGGAAGALLLGRLLKGPQDVTWSDSANEAVVRMWRTFGGHLDHARACDWMLVLRPAAWVRAGIAAALRGHRPGRELVPVGALPLHAITDRAAKRRQPKGLDPDISGLDVDAAEIVEHLPRLTSRLRVRVDY
ncbi:MAG: hypothetical protein GEU88_17775, partial [Solirubrobacterales bacterium]|nr:hypothetical protein [Solirubrobacterales bacterium]